MLILRNKVAKHAKRLDGIIANARGKHFAVGFEHGTQLVREMIDKQSELYDAIDATLSTLEQMSR